MKYISIILTVSSFLFFSACMVMMMKEDRYTRQLTVKAHDLAAIAETIVRDTPFNLEVTNMNEGVIETSWENFPGSEHGIWWWKRQWIGNARYKITIDPAFSDPENLSNIQISWEVRERPNENYDWIEINPGDSSHAYTKASSILNKIVSKSRTPQ